MLPSSFVIIVAFKSTNDRLFEASELFDTWQLSSLDARHNNIKGNNNNNNSEVEVRFFSKWFLFLICCLIANISHSLGATYKNCPSEITFRKMQRGVLTLTYTYVHTQYSTTTGSQVKNYVVNNVYRKGWLSKIVFKTHTAKINDVCLIR